jgi:hypothetical protein
MRHDHANSSSSDDVPAWRKRTQKGRKRYTKLRRRECSSGSVERGICRIAAGRRSRLILSVAEVGSRHVQQLPLSYVPMLHVVVKARR